MRSISRSMCPRMPAVSWENARPIETSTTSCRHLVKFGFVVRITNDIIIGDHLDGHTVCCSVVVCFCVASLRVAQHRPNLISKYCAQTTSSLRKCRSHCPIYIQTPFSMATTKQQIWHGTLCVLVLVAMICCYDVIVSQIHEICLCDSLPFFFPLKNLYYMR